MFFKEKFISLWNIHKKAIPYFLFLFFSYKDQTYAWLLSIN